MAQARRQSQGGLAQGSAALAQAVVGTHFVDAKLMQQLAVGGQLDEP